eukprot:scaffold25180_cov59-Phaeocystis_antarctica.AAC.2
MHAGTGTVSSLWLGERGAPLECLRSAWSRPSPKMRVSGSRASKLWHISACCSAVGRSSLCPSPTPRPTRARDVSVPARDA